MRIVITGANRGIGLEFAHQYLARGEEVEAAVRRPEAAAALAALVPAAGGRLRIHGCDVGSDESVRALSAALGAAPIDLLINNAGVGGPRTPLERLETSAILRTMDVNAVGPLRVTAALLPGLRLSQVRKVVSISSGLGSITDNTSGDAYAYRMSKAALNMACRSVAVDLRSEGFTAVVLNPGWVRTDMGGPSAPTAVEESVRLMIELIDRLGPEQSGSFLDYRGHSWPW